MVRLLLVKTLKQSPSQRNWKQMEKILDAAEKAMPNSPDILVLRAEMLSSQGRAADAEKLLSEARDKNESSLPYGKALITFAEGDKDQKKSARTLERIAKSPG